MATERFTNPTTFRDALRLKVPRVIRSRAQAVYLDAATELHEAVILETPVDRGYLRAGFLASAPGVSIAPPREPRASDGTGSFLSIATQKAVEVANGLALAAGALFPITMGFVALYAPYVEDRVHMVKRARGRWRTIVRGAVARAREAKQLEGGER